MKTVDLKLAGLNFIQSEAWSNAVLENEALNLNYSIVQGNELIEVSANGNRRVLRKSRFTTVQLTTQKREFTLNFEEVSETF
ncbi:hypothetical protein [Flavobacterium sp. NKUCC04_CG]|uniref:hypothetical protein n=1 Tax=Flavobacterium sp. NKUCC04_CG TaxID=2842121 RepID=UPI001C5A69BA|nr:hypothetical protein [Flavobacterium sp. NKUCC04_CG]MBW3517556.1 hypothetical protein [Flavobacterium sp. NKUCC04_CG]